MLIAVTAGTDFRNVDDRLSQSIRGPHKRNLYLATGDGSEIFGFDKRSQPVALWKRNVTAEEAQLHSDVANTVRREIVARTGLAVDIVDDRPDRRQIALLLGSGTAQPTPAATEPIAAIDRRLNSAGFDGGVGEVMGLARRVTAVRGLQPASWAT